MAQQKRRPEISAAALREAVAQDAEMSTSDLNLILSRLAVAIEDALSAGNRVKLTGIGSLQVEVKPCLLKVRPMGLMIRHAHYVGGWMRD